MGKGQASIFQKRFLQFSTLNFTLRMNNLALATRSDGHLFSHPSRSRSSGDICRRGWKNYSRKRLFVFSLQKVAGTILDKNWISLSTLFSTAKKRFRGFMDSWIRIVIEAPIITGLTFNLYFSKMEAPLVSNLHTNTYMQITRRRCRSCKRVASV